MQGRTFFRIMIDNMFINNPFCKALSALVKFCNEQSIFYKKELKFSKKIPLYNNKNLYNHTKFIFDTKQAIGAKSD